MKPFFKSLTLFCFFIIWGTAALAQTSKVILTVNDIPITQNDVTNRSRLTLLSTGMTLSPANIKRYESQSLNAIIDETLILQEAKKEKVKVSNKEVAKAIAGIAQRNKIPGGDLNTYLIKKGLSPQSLKRKVLSQLAWQKLALKKYRGRILVNDVQAKAELKRLESSLTGVQKHIYEIFIQTNSAKSAQTAKNTLSDVSARLKKGENFAKLARIFSQSQSAQQGGDMGWTFVQQVPLALRGPISHLKPGQISDPIRTPSGYYLIAVNGERNVSEQNRGALVDLEQIVIPFPPNIPKRVAYDQFKKAKQLRARLTSCAAASNIVKKSGYARIKQTRGIPLSSLPVSLRNSVSRLKIGGKTPVLKNSGALFIFMLCGKKHESAQMPSLKSIKGRLYAQQLENLTRQYLRDLRASAVIVRYGKE